MVDSSTQPFHPTPHLTPDEMKQKEAKAQQKATQKAKAEQKRIEEIKQKQAAQQEYLSKLSDLKEVNDASIQYITKEVSRLEGWDTGSPFETHVWINQAGEVKYLARGDALQSIDNQYKSQAELFNNKKELGFYEIRFLSSPFRASGKDDASLNSNIQQIKDHLLERLNAEKAKSTP